MYMNRTATPPIKENFLVLYEQFPYIFKPLSSIKKQPTVIKSESNIIKKLYLKLTLYIKKRKHSIIKIYK